MDHCHQQQPPSPEKPVPEASLKSYFPLLLILGYVGGISFILGSGHDFMANFMGGFFLTFSFFKFLDLKGFADAYKTYDVVAKKVPIYGFIYPFLELGLGIGYVARIAPTFVDGFTLILMGVSGYGVLQSLLKKQKIQCACLGTSFNLPMTKVTLFEDLLMAAMAAWSLMI